MYCVKNYLYQVLTLYLIQLCVFLHWSQALHKPEGLTYIHTEKTDVHFTNIIYATRHDRKRSSPDSLPESLDVHFRVRDNHLNLRMYRNTKLSSDVPIYLHNSTADENRHWPNVQSPSAFYQDVGNMASFHLECVSNDDGTCGEFELFGTFYIEDEFYILESDTVTDGPNSIKTTRPYRISQPLVPLHFSNDQSSTEQLSSKSSLNRRTGRRRRATGSYTVELFVVTDYSVYTFWYDASSQTTNQGKRNDAINKIRTFVAFHINGIDARYASLNLGYTIDVTFAGLYIAENAASSSWTETVKSSIGTVDVNVVIGNFRQWVQSETAAGNIPAHDHAMLFSRYDFISQGNSDNIGYAFKGEMCTTASQSIVEDRFNFIVETTAAHELGHSLGAKHDGIENSCFAQNANIMAISSSAKTGNTAKNPWIFSSCSASEINDLLNTLNSNGNNCLLTTNSQTDPNQINSYKATQIGQLFDVNQQCVKAFGQGSYMCLNFYTDYETICTGLWCKSPTSTACRLVIPADGTTCNTLKWCEQGNCLTSNNAPNLPSTCLYGDSKGIVYNTFTCQDIGTQVPWACYSYNTSCCTTCQSLHTGQNGCEYGDRTDCSAISSNQCYAGDNANLCCKTCQDFHTGIPGCEYGDQADCTGVVPSQCYTGNNANICCQTCLGYYTAIPGCLYGDKSVGCNHTKCGTYSQANLDICCFTCYPGTPPSTLGPVTIPPTTQEIVTTTLPTTSTIGPATSDPPTTVSVTQTTVVPVNNTTFPTAKTNLPAWIIPVAATAAGIVIILVLVCVACYCLRTRKPKPTKPPGRGPSTISRGGIGGARHQSFTGTTNVAYQMDSVPGTDHYNYISPQNVSGPRISAVSRQLPPPARPPPRRPPQPSTRPTTGQDRSFIKSNTTSQPASSPHEYVEVTDYQALQARQSTKSRTYESLKYPHS
ncbi:zinc metalloproteinase/disintegrin-like HR1a isoform X1 [Pecten maximus]|uniref:zinc metalloproteinase/disintegrin-like HR1a isoform X1 n=1 Tax=Pecten maximus TaxID=6579 RepID=UPI001457FEDF|nr:zinc metalloproteinase/disintegrin-like HR1a isoform X1 [Pecten maximus]